MTEPKIFPCNTGADCWFNSVMPGFFAVDPTPGEHDTADGAEACQKRAKALNPDVTTPNMPATRRQVQDMIRAKIDPDAAVLEVKNGGGFGVVLYVSPLNVLRYVVHRWAIVDTAGAAIPNGGMLYDGGYHFILEEALEDFRNRRPR